jgi:hypothetical protein
VPRVLAGSVADRPWDIVSECCQFPVASSQSAETGNRKLETGN